MLASLTGIYTRWKVRWALWSGWEGEEEKPVKIKAAKVRQGHVRKWEELNALEKADGGIFLSYFMVWCAHALSCERWSDRSAQSASCRCSWECQISGCHPVILWVCLSMAKIPEKHWRPRYLAIWTTNPKYIFSHYSSLLYSQSKDESPNQRTPVAHDIILTHECPLLWGDLRSPGLRASLLLPAVLCAASRSCAVPWTSSLSVTWGSPWGHRRGRTHFCLCYSTDCGDLDASFPLFSQLLQFSSFCFNK